MRAATPAIAPVGACYPSGGLGLAALIVLIRSVMRQV